MHLLDEAMVAVLHEDLDLERTGNIYCHPWPPAMSSSISAARASGLTRPRSGCLGCPPPCCSWASAGYTARRCFRSRGSGRRAEQEAARVLRDLADLHVASVAEVHHRVGEMRRLRGDVQGAEATYVRARELGRDPPAGPCPAVSRAGPNGGCGGGDPGGAPRGWAPTGSPGRGLASHRSRSRWPPRSRRRAARLRRARGQLHEVGPRRVCRPRRRCGGGRASPQVIDGAAQRLPVRGGAQAPRSETRTARTDHACFRPGACHRSSAARSRHSTPSCGMSRRLAVGSTSWQVSTTTR